MTVLLSFILVAGTLAVVVCLYAWHDPAPTEVDGPADGWAPPGTFAGHPLEWWADPPRPHRHSEPTLEAVATCLYCGSAHHSTFLHASR